MIGSRRNIRSPLLFLFFLSFALLLLTSSVSAAEASTKEEETSAVSTKKNEKIRACTGKNLDPEDDLRIGKIKTKDCFHFQKSSVGKYLRMEYTLYRFADCHVVQSTKIDGRTFIFELGGKQVKPALDIGMNKMCVGEKRRITAPGFQAHGSFHHVTRTGEEIWPNSTLVWDVKLLEVLDEPPSEYINGVLEAGEDAFPVGSPLASTHSANGNVHLWYEIGRSKPEWYKRHKHQFKNEENTYEAMMTEFNRNKAKRGIPIVPESEWITRMDPTLPEVANFPPYEKEGWEPTEFLPSIRQMKMEEVVEDEKEL